MSNTALRVRNLGKMYQIGSKQEKYKTFRDAIAQTISTPFRRARDLLRGQAYGAAGLKEEIWALRDISFEVQHGEVLGIIGHNGAGKSTLLKILSQITEPTEGYVDIYGRVGSLLEVGTGFHPELTGRENVYLNGAILGMSRREIDRKFDEIVDFAGVEKFIDTPVKHYSSGMGLRLGFAVAAYLEPDILVVDEVLAVGDAAFQKKCLGKMNEVAEEGRTVLFVSHNMEAINNLCTKTYVLENGMLAYEGDVHASIQYYLKSASNSYINSKPNILFENELANSNCVTRIEMLNENKSPKTTLFTWDCVTFRIHYNLDEIIDNGSIVLDIRDAMNRRLIVMDSGLKVPLLDGRNYIDCFIPMLPLAAGEFYITIGLAISRSEWIWKGEQVGILQVLGKDVFDLGRPPIKERMLFAVDHVWYSNIN